MLNIIVYEDNEIFMKKNVDAINKAMVSCDVDYRIHKFSSYSKGLDEFIHNDKIKKIYILDVEMNGTSGLELAARIREDDWDSIIIIATAYDKYHNDVFYTRLMVLDFICKYNGYEARLKEDIVAASKITYKQKTFVFSYNHNVYRIPYSHICFIEKEPIIKRCIIHTINNNFYIVKSINWLSENLGSDFLKTHQSCVVNLSNIKKIDCSTNTITFRNGDSTNLLSEKRKKEVKQYVGMDK